MKENFLLLKSLSRKNKVFVFTFAIISLVSFFLLFIGDKYKFYFHQDMIDSFMDLFNSVVGNKQRGGNLGSYPPMAILPYKILARLVPWNIFDQSLYGRDLAFVLRASVPGTFILFLHIFCFILPFIFICKKILNKNESEKILYVTVFMLSGIMLFSLERGNNVVYAFLFTFLFVALMQYYPRYKQLAYFSLVIAASLKLYPAIFGLLILEKKDIKGCIICVVEFFALYYIAYCLCGLHTETTYVAKIAEWTQSVTQSALGLNFSIKNFLLLVDKFIYYLSGEGDGYFSISKIIFTITKIFLLLSGVFSYFYSNLQWKKLCSLSFLCILVPDVSFQYVLLFMFIPLVFFINEENEDIEGCLFGITFAVLISMLIIPLKVDLPRYFASAGFIVQFVMLFVMWCIITIQAILNFLQVNMLKNHK